MLAALFALSLPAEAAEIQVTGMAAIMVLVDGRAAEGDPNTGMIVVGNLPAGRHQVETRNLMGKTTAYKEFDLAGDDQIRFEYRKRELWHIGTYKLAVATPPPPPPVAIPGGTTTVTETVTVGGPGVGITVSDGTETVSLGVGPFGAGVVVSDGVDTVAVNAGVTVTETTSTTTVVQHGGPGYAPPPPPPAPVAVAMDERTFGSFLSTLDNATFSDDKHAVLRSTAANNWFSCDQLRRILEMYSHGSDKVEAVGIVRPSIVDPQNAFVINDSFSFSSDAQKAQAFFR